MLTDFHMNVAASIQAVTEEVVLRLTKNLAKQYKIKNLCLAGGVALNCVANGKIKKSNIFENIWVQPAAGDAGGSLGAALAYWHQELNKPRKVNPKDNMNGSYLGPKYNENFIETELITLKAKFKKYNNEKLIEIVADKLCKQQTAGWFQGRMEFGPRALGARSILADPRSDKMQKNLNLKIKFRESFRPFAPSILRDDVNEWFEFNDDSPYMLMVAPVKENLRIAMSEKDKKLFGIDKLNLKRSSIPAVTHIDYSVRIQTVHKSTNEKYYKLIKKFKDLTGCPILVNTSFNIRGEPIVCTIKDAFKCFMGTNLDIMVCGNFLLLKDEQDKNLLKNYQSELNLD
jgi:carbamoyltransferase